MKSQMASPTFTPTYAALVAVSRPHHATILLAAYISRCLFATSLAVTSPARSKPSWAAQVGTCAVHSHAHFDLRHDMVLHLSRVEVAPDITSPAAASGACYRRAR